MDRFGRVQEVCRRSRARERGRDFRQTMPDLPMPVTITRPRQSSSIRIAVEAIVEPIDERKNRGSLGLKHLLRERASAMAVRMIVIDVLRRGDTRATSSRTTAAIRLSLKIRARAGPDAGRWPRRFLRARAPREPP